MTNESKVSILKENGWLEYYGNTWILKAWVIAGLPYDKMSVSLDEAFKSVEPHPFDKFHELALKEGTKK